MDVSLLGPLEVRDDSGRSLAIGTRRHQAVLAMLALEPRRVVTVDRIVDGVWGERPPAKAVANVQSYVSNLRRTLEPDRPPRAPATRLVTRGAGYVLEVAPDELDVSRFQRLVTTAATTAEEDPEAALDQLVDALSLSRGPVLAGLRDEPFAAAEVVRLEARVLAAEEERVELLLRLGRAQEALPLLHRLIEQHPAGERLRAQLVTALYRTGRQVDALEEHRRHVHELAESYGLDPSPAFLSLRDAVLRHEPPAALVPGTPAATGRTRAATPRGPAPGPAPAPVQVAPPADLVGRETELGRLRELLHRARDGVGAVVLVSGEPGIGKSRLLETLVAEAAAGDVLTAVGRCYEGGGAPAFWPFVELARQLGNAVGDADPAAAAAAAELLSVVTTGGAGDGDGLGAIIEPTARFLVADRVTAAVRRLAERRPLVLGIDDVYGADPDSLEVLVRLGAAVAALPVLVVATFRTSVLPPGHPLATALGELVRFGHVERIAPRPLTAEETRSLLTREGSGPLDHDTVERVRSRTGGNPFFTVELARLLAAGADASRQVPDGVREVLRLRTARLPTPTQDLLRIGAVQGRSFTAEVVAAIGELDPVLADERLEPAVAAQLVAPDRDRPGTYRFSHVLVQEAMADELTALRRASVHAQVAAALAPLAEVEPATWGRIAHHAVAAVPVTGPSAAIEPLTAAARHSVAANAHELAQQQVEQRLELCAQLPVGRDRDRAELAARLDLCAVLPVTTGWHAPELEAAGRRVTELGRATGDLDAVVQGLSARSANACVTARYHLEDEIYASELAVYDQTGDPAHGFLAEHGMAMVQMFRGDLADAAATYRRGERLLAQADPGDRARLRIPPDRMAGVAHHASLWSITLWLTGDAEGSERQITRALEIADRDGHLQTIWTVWFSHHQLAYCRGDHEGLLAGEARRHEQASELRSPLVGGLLGVPSAWARARAGDAAAADEAAALADALTANGARVFASIFRGMVADALLHHGRDEDALDAVDGALRWSEELGERMWDAELHRLRAVALGLLGHEDRAGAALAAGLEVARSQGAVPLVARIESTRAALADADAPRLVVPG